MRLQSNLYTSAYFHDLCIITMQDTNKQKKLQADVNLGSCNNHFKMYKKCDNISLQPKWPSP